jgi:hypothetical protein
MKFTKLFIFNIYHCFRLHFICKNWSCSRDSWACIVPCLMINQWQFFLMTRYVSGVNQNMFSFVHLQEWYDEPNHQVENLHL